MLPKFVAYLCLIVCCVTVIMLFGYKTDCWLEQCRYNAPSPQWIRRKTGHDTDWPLYSDLNIYDTGQIVYANDTGQIVHANDTGYADGMVPNVYADDTAHWIYYNYALLPVKPILLRSTAWLDTRPQFNDTPCLRLQILYPNRSIIIRKNLATHRTKCFLWDENRKLLSIVTKPDIHFLFGVKKFFAYGVHYSEALLTFRLGNLDKNPREISVVFKVNHTPRHNITVVEPLAHSHNDTRDLAVCVIPLYRHRQNSYTPRFVEWIEALRMFGISEFHIYNCSLSLSPTIARVFQDYVQQGIIYVHQFHTPFTLPAAKATDEYECVGIQEKAAINDCMYKNMHRFKQLIMLDPDEFLVPYKTETYPEMVRLISKQNPSVVKASSIAFRTRQFYLEFSSLRYEDFVSTNYFKYNSDVEFKKPIIKSFVFPTRCIYAFSHGCFYSPLNPIYDNFTYGSTHHYRESCAMGYTAKSRKRLQDRCADLKMTQHEERRMLHFKKSLLYRIGEVNKRLSLNLSTSLLMSAE